ncbi:MAG: prepilin peptidase [Phycisphaeraceae bacterium]|nr:prepilin peptidase [Phycisphaerae bacterium]MBX3393628.1 prepilin peptidase [Phycisphaeraceae bacterium]
METWQVYMLAFGVLQTAFVLALGACVGSLINVLVYRMPLGLSVVSPPSRCPSCQTRLTWRENIPVLGWILLGGKCRFCRASISPEYPIVEAFVGLLFAAVYAVWFVLPSDWSLQGITVASMRPEWTLGGIGQMWPSLVVVLTLLASLTAMTLVDAKTSMIPLALAWTPAAIGVLVHPIHAAYVQHAWGRLIHVAPGWTWSISSPGPLGWPMVGLALGGLAGMVVSNILLATGLIRRSWSDYDQWEKDHLASPASPLPAGTDVPADAAPSQAGSLAPADAAEAVSSPQAPMTGLASGDSPSAASVLAGESSSPVPHRGDADPGQHAEGSPSDLWLEYPHARREVLKESVFLGPIVAGAMAGMLLAMRLSGPWIFDVNRGESVPAIPVPLWLDVLAGVIGGYLIGGGVVWAVRILGTLGFGREAMGMGDVHLLAAVGACVGWIDATLAFFGAAFVGLAYAAVAAVFKGFRRAMPYGPHIAVAAALVILFKPAVERFLTILLRSDPPVNLP